MNWLSRNSCRKNHPYANLALSSILPLLVRNDCELLDILSLGFVILPGAKRVLVEKLHNSCPLLHISVS